MDIDDVISKLETLWKKAETETYELIKLPDYMICSVSAPEGSTMAIKHFQTVPDENDCADVFSDAVVTSKAHSQNMSNLCAPFTVITVLRSEVRRHIRNKLRQRISNLDRLNR